MTRLLPRLFAYYADYHADGTWRLRAMGALGALVLTAFYFLRFTREAPDLWGDVMLRSICLVAFVLLALGSQWPRNLRRYYIAYSYAALTLCLPFFSMWLALERGGGVPAISNFFIVLWFLILVTDWRNTLTMLVIGISLAVAAYLAFNPEPRWPRDFLLQVPAYAVMVVGGSLFKVSTQRVEMQRKLATTEALAGSIAHEMRHPILQIKHHIEWLRRLLPITMLDASEEHMSGAELSVQRALQVVSMTLDEMDGKPPDVRNFQLLSAQDCTENAIHRFAYETEDARSRIQLKTQGDFHFLGDETSYLFLLFNLFNNALYYVPLCPDMKITVTVWPDRVTVRDTGPGMTPQALETLFLPFASDGKVDGTGLGLTYCRRVVDAFGGEIRCESVLGEYAEFTLRFPAMPAASPAAQTSPKVLPPEPSPFNLLRGRTILLADDSTPARKIMTAFLEEAGATVKQASHGQQVLDVLATMPHCDAIFMDIDMPGMTGLEATRAIRRGPRRTRGVPIIALTAHSTVAMTRSASDAGMDAFVSKPADARTLSEILVPMLGAPWPAAEPEQEAPPVEPELLDMARLESCAQVGMLDKLMEDYLALVPELLQALRVHLEKNEFQAAASVMHSLMGASANAGLQALRDHLAGISREVSETGLWPGGDAWLLRASDIAARSDVAMRAYSGSFKA